MTPTIQTTGRSLTIHSEGKPITADQLIPGNEYDVNLFTGEIKGVIVDNKHFNIYAVPEGKGRFYCGPTVLAMLTGHTREKIHRDINRMKRARGWQLHKPVNGRWKIVPWPLDIGVKGMFGEDLERMLVKYGLRPEWRKKGKYPSLRQLVADIGHFKTPILVNVTGHYVLYYAGIVYDTRHPTGAPVDQHWYGRCRVKSYWIIKKQPQPKA